VRRLFASLAGLCFFGFFCFFCFCCAPVAGVVGTASRTWLLVVVVVFVFGDVVSVDGEGCCCFRYCCCCCCCSCCSCFWLFAARVAVGGADLPAMRAAAAGTRVSLLAVAVLMRFCVDGGDVLRLSTRALDLDRSDLASAAWRLLVFALAGAGCCGCGVAVSASALLAAVSSSVSSSADR
jgi:hypothetical protein